MAQQIEVLNVLEKKLMALVELVKATTSTATATSSTPPRMHKSIEASVSQDLLFSTQVRLETLSLSHLSLAPSIRTTFRLQRTCWTCTKLFSFVSWPLNLSSHFISVRWVNCRCHPLRDRFWERNHPLRLLLLAWKRQSQQRRRQTCARRTEVEVRLSIWFNNRRLRQPTKCVYSITNPCPMMTRCPLVASSNGRRGLSSKPRRKNRTKGPEKANDAIPFNIKSSPTVVKLIRVNKIIPFFFLVVSCHWRRF